jgi:hypothetical protein
LFERPQGAKEKGKKGNNNLDPWSRTFERELK